MSNIIEELTEWTVYHLKGFDERLVQNNEPNIMNVNYKIVQIEYFQQKQLTIFDILEGSDWL
ncbi:hypothetical protein [Mammaliicoccus sciuri]|uniref:Uncharacterized protein n=1 Tax=Mammaliicoccus sciuri TaxID=1296 RepID=A0AAI8DKZ0_MAMSC|nr:hypothetical protein [Mammaliicoccus sciuri]ASE35699.1 hypothetical protein CEP64_13855 [Mammaliicoccus sciuri]MEB7784200.1 hypothetical protein [Mammaliicoccus sciuri]